MERVVATLNLGIVCYFPHRNRQRFKTIQIRVGHSFEEDLVDSSLEDCADLQVLGVVQVGGVDPGGSWRKTFVSARVPT